MAHESFQRSEPVATSSNRSFGLVFTVLFLVIGTAPLLSREPPRYWALAIACTFLLAALLFAGVLAPLNRLWMKLGALLHRVVNPVILGILFYLVITPMGLGMRALGKNPLRLGREAKLHTYWIERMPPGPPPESFTDQF